MFRDDRDVPGYPYGKNSRVPQLVTTAEALLPHLNSCGYGDAQIARSFAVDRVTIEVAAFAGKPWDSWSACLAAVNLDGDSKATAAKVRALGVATVFVCGPERIDWWAMGPEGPTSNRPIAWTDAAAVFHQHRDDLSPSRIYDAKLRRLGTQAGQMWFFDAGLMPAIEKNRGETLLRLVERAIDNLRGELSTLLDSRQAQEDVYRTVFWLLAAKVLHDKHVPKFKNINLKDVEQVFDRIGNHHGDTGRLPPFGKRGRSAIEAVASSIADCGSLADVSSESIAYVYENALIDKAAGTRGARTGDKPYDIRKDLGIHSTPPVLIQHMLSQLWPLIEQIKPEDRHVFEPACGHAPFLTGALRWLRQWDDNGQPVTSHDYMRKHLHGVEANSFFIELAKLALTLADEPHGNSWDIAPSDMFLPGVLAKEAKKARILLANPPYEAFTVEKRSKYKRAGEAVTAQTKAVEMLARTLPHLPGGSVFGVVVPQGVLYQAEAAELRRLLVAEFEISEIALFADNLFEKGDAETAILMGRRHEPTGERASVQYRRVREKGMDAFKDRLSFSSESLVSQERFVAASNYDLRVPELEEIWEYTRGFPQLSDLASVGRGLTHHGRFLPQGTWTVEPFRSGRGQAGFARIPTAVNIYGLPKTQSINLDRKAVQTSRAGTTFGVPQVLLNHHPVGRGPWRLKTLLDRAGHVVKGVIFTVRPSDPSVPLEYFWALLNSPLANAFVYSYSQKRHVYLSTVRLIPMPPAKPANVTMVVEAARACIEIAQKMDAESPKVSTTTRSRRPKVVKGIGNNADGPTLFGPKGTSLAANPNEPSLKSALLHLDAEVLRLYSLPPRLERQLLDLFTGVERKGVGCDFRGYYPPGFSSYLPLHHIISEQFQRAAADRTVDRFKPGESPYVREVLETASTGSGEE